MACCQWCKYQRMLSLAVSEVRHCMLYSRHDKYVYNILGPSQVARNLPSIVPGLMCHWSPVCRQTVSKGKGRPWTLLIIRIWLSQCRCPIWNTNSIWFTCGTMYLRDSGLGPFKYCIYTVFFWKFDIPPLVTVGLPLTHIHVGPNVYL